MSRMIKALLASAVIALGMATIPNSLAGAAPASNATNAQSTHANPNARANAGQNGGAAALASNRTFGQSESHGFFNFLSHFFGSLFSFLQHLFQIIFGGGGGPGPSVTP